MIRTPSRVELASPPKSSEERTIKRDVGIWRACLYPAAVMPLVLTTIMKMRSVNRINNALHLARLRKIGLPIFLTTGFMELWGDNYLLSKKMPEGFYKFQYEYITSKYGTKFYLPDELVEEYWRENTLEFQWRFECKALSTLLKYKDTTQREKIRELRTIKESYSIESNFNEEFWQEKLDYWNNRPQRVNFLNISKNYFSSFKKFLFKTLVDVGRP
ncbi:unnamed protein product [Oikopleura dioica]|uniref:Uncharacterized protein n=1 Tax=Oikopleura dioica TaxID=34765 RepID=E4XTK3_OIKDI|nr:unnamed protein product [Oikopleura dioica]